MSVRSTIWLASCEVTSARYAIGYLTAVVRQNGMILAEDLRQIDERLVQATELIQDAAKALDENEAKLASS